MGKSAMRNAGIDRVRVAMTALVVFHHTAIVYGGAGGWFWREQPNASNPLLVMFNTVNQSYFMGFFFLLAGYFTPAALDRKGPRKFLQDRLVRLGVPLLVFFFILHPMTVAIAQTADGASFLPAWADMIRSRVFGPGPLWFAEALLLFTLAFVLWVTASGRTATADRSPGSLPPASLLLIVALALGFISFAVRLIVPVGKEVLWLQLGYFPCYVALFAAGCAAAPSRLLEQVSLRNAAPWMTFSAIGIGILPVVMLTRGDAGRFEGGWTLNALFYALWDPIVAWGMILGLLWGAQRWWRKATPFGDWLARGAFGAYIVHPPLLVGLSVWMSHMDAAPLVKFVVVGASATAASFVVSALLRILPGTRQVL